MDQHAAAPAATTVILGFDNPEDIALIPGTDWIVTSGYAHGAMRAPRSFFVHTRSHAVRPAWPGNCVFDLDRARFGDIEPPDVVSFHGLDVTRRPDGVIVMHQVNHPVVSADGARRGRESVEVFEVDLTPEGPVLRWRGGVVAPIWVGGNDVCALPEGGFAVTNTAYRREAGAMVLAGAISGHVLEWRDRDEGWRIVEGTDVSSPNGIAVSPDGAHLFVASWATGRLHKISRADPHGARSSVDTGVLIDNITWTPDGRLLLAGQVATPQTVYAALNGEVETLATPLRAIRVDPETMQAELLLAVDTGDRFATTALQVGETEVWTGAILDRRVMVHRLG